MKTVLYALAVLASVAVPASAQQADRQTRILLPFCTVRENHGKMDRVKRFEALANQARTRGDSRAVFDYYTAALCELRRSSKNELKKERWYAAAANVDFRYWIANAAAGLKNPRVCVTVLSPVLTGAGAVEVGWHFIQRSQCFYDLKRNDEALRDAFTAVRVSPLLGESYRHLGKGLAFAGDAKQAGEFSMRADALDRAWKELPRVSFIDQLRLVSESLQAQGFQDLAQVATEKAETRRHEEVMAARQARASGRAQADREAAIIAQIVSGINQLGETVGAARRGQAAPSGSTGNPGLDAMLMAAELEQKRQAAEARSLIRTPGTSSSDGTECGIVLCKDASDCFRWKGVLYTGGNAPRDDPAFVACAAYKK